ncbi:MAG TPA: M28 family peptidase [Treponemataceae bacterium]|nr:M28 family peptidase [Treponemataceae bacterium]
MNDKNILSTSGSFEAFLKPNIDRPEFISRWLTERKIPHNMLELAGKKHIIVRFSSSSYDPRFRMKTLVAHHDRVENTPGANDNSAACFQLMLCAQRLNQLDSVTATPYPHNTRIIFTDGEEAAGDKGVSGQGSYRLGEGLRRLKMTDDDVFVFDACGRGDTLIVSTSGMNTRGKIGNNLDRVHAQATKIALKAAPGSWVQLPTPYSDNAGFIAAGIAAQVITILPHEEASLLLRGFGNSVVEQEKLMQIITGKGIRDPNNGSLVIPETWTLMHTQEDTAASLTPQAFTLMEKVLTIISKMLDPLP